MFGLFGSGKSKDVLSPTKANDAISPISPTPVNDNDKTSSSVVPTISMDQLKKITTNFSNGALIGEGSYNNVYLGVLKDGQKSAIKRPKHTRTILEVTAIYCLFHPFNYSSQIISITSLSTPAPLRCRFRTSQNTNMRMLSSFSDVVLKEIIVFLFMSIPPGAPCMIFFMVSCKFQKFTVWSHLLEVCTLRPCLDYCILRETEGFFHRPPKLTPKILRAP
jgi:hypothetical protein